MTLCPLRDYEQAIRLCSDEADKADYEEQHHAIVERLHPPLPVQIGGQEQVSFWERLEISSTQRASIRSQLEPAAVLLDDKI